MKNENISILLVDDEKDILEFLSYNIRKEGYIVYTATSGPEALQIVQKKNIQLVVLDVMMPGMDGIETCQEMRKIPKMKNAIIIFLTARGEDYSQIAGLEAGADDYITKPVKPKVFISKIKSLLRRFEAQEIQQIESNKIIEVGDLIIDEDKYIVIKNQVEINLPKKEFELLQLLASRPNKVFTREEIFYQIWGSDVVVGDRTIDVHIRKIREKLNIDNIKTIKGVGYKFEV